MKRHSKGLSAATAALGLCLYSLTSLVAPSLAGATASTSDFCSNLPATISKVNSSMSNLESKLSAAQTARTQNLATNRAKWDQALATDRADWAQKRQAQFSLLSSKATTADETTAVNTYETTITAAIAAREAANDTAIATFRSAEDSLISSQQATVNGQVATFSNAVIVAEDTATASCQGSSANGPTTRTTFVAAMKSTRTTFVNDRSADGKLGTQIQALAQTRDAAVDSNDATFQTTANNAGNALKAAF